jgi:hypothetical protein
MKDLTPMPRKRELCLDCPWADTLIDGNNPDNTIRPHSSTGYRPPAPEALAPFLTYTPHGAGPEISRNTHSEGGTMSGVV